MCLVALVESKAAFEFQREHGKVGPTVELLQGRPYLHHRRVIHQVAAGIIFALYCHPFEGALALLLSPRDRPRLEERYKRDIVIAGHALREVAKMMNKRSNMVFGHPGKGGEGGEGGRSTPRVVVTIAASMS